MVTPLSNCYSIVLQERASLGDESVADSVTQCLHGRIQLSSILAAVDMC